MGDTEEYFPRGGQKPTAQHFKQSSNFLGAPERAEKKKKRPKKKSEADDGYLSDEAEKELDYSYVNCAIGLSYKTVKPGVLILGRVRQVQETRVHVMLPSKMMGTVLACHISEAYNKILEAYVNDQTDTVLELPSMFRPGQYVAVKVLEVSGEHLMLSMMPNHVNGGMMHTDLRVGCLLQAAVCSVEDHGYVMDIGVPNTRAFLPKKECNPEMELDTGMLTWCTVKLSTLSSPTATLALTSRLDALRSGVLKKKPTTALLPGAGVDFIVDQPLDNGIEGHIFSDTTAYVQRQHAAKAKDKKPGLGHRVRARILYVMPTRNTPFLTLRDIFETTYPDLAKEQKFKEGHIIEDAQVIKITGRSIHLKLGKRALGTLSLRRINVDEDLSDEEVVANSYPLGSTHKVRVLTYHLSDYMYSVSDQPAILNEKYFTYDQLSPGDIVTGTVESLSDGTVTLAVGRLTGYVPHAHLFDSGIFVDPKKATTSKLSKKKYKVGQEVSARVLSVDPLKPTLRLTLKPTLLAPDLEVLSSYEEGHIGKAYTGVIKHIRDEYILVSFFNNVTAYVGRSYVTRDPEVSLRDAFHVGQIVLCTVLKVDEGGSKMTGSLTTAPFPPEKRREVQQKRKQQSQDSDHIPNKKLRTDSESSDTTHKKKKKDKKVKAKEDTRSEEETGKKNKKLKKTSVSEDDGQIESSKSKKKDKKSKQIEETTEIEHKKKKSKKSKDSDEESGIDNKLDQADSKKKRKKINAAVNSEESDAIETDLQEELTLEDLGLIEDDTHIKKNKEISSEESDAIEIDIEVLSPQELGLIDLSDCYTQKHYTKRVVSLLKAIKARTTRLDRIDKKIQHRETLGLTYKNKKFHTAMQTDKLMIEDRIKKLMDALKIAQEKLKTFGVEDKKNYKTAKELKSERKESQQDSGKREIEQKEERVDKVKKETKIPKINVVEDLEPVLEVPSAKDFWSTDPDALVKNVPRDESSSSDDEEEEQPKKKRKKLSIAEKVAKVRGEEERVREMERRAIESESQPRSSDQFERALLANPDCSQLWIAYMAFHLQATEIEKARAVGRKALSTINFREEQERLNVWLALLNCEHRFGTKETQQKTLEEALQMNDTFKIHSKLLDILVETGKPQELSALIDQMIRKYKRNPNNYILCGSACFRLGMVDKARQVMQKAVAVLDKKDHVFLLVQFALLERSHGAGERSEALFEQVLAVYPQRVDVCSVYADMLVKSGDAEKLRQVMERMTSQKLPAKKMKVLYKKWIDIEEKLGDQEEVEKIRQRAMEFIEKAKF